MKPGTLHTCPPPAAKWGHQPLRRPLPTLHDRTLDPHDTDTPSHRRLIPFLIAAVVQLAPWRPSSSFPAARGDDHLVFQEGSAFMKFNTKLQALAFLSNHPGARDALVDVLYERLQADSIPAETLTALKAAEMIVWDAGTPRGFLKRSPGWILDRNGSAVLSALRSVEDPRKWKTERNVAAPAAPISNLDVADRQPAGRIPTTPGWYPDPDRQPDEAFRRRYWDGSAWTERFD